jgi:hypothetical protein
MLRLRVRLLVFFVCDEIHLPYTEGYLTDSVAKFGTPALLEGLTSGSTELQRRYAELFAELTQNCTCYLDVVDNSNVILSDIQMAAGNECTCEGGLLFNLVQG